MKSSLVLHDGQLELLEIASKWLSNAWSAFLSACHAAAGLEDLPGEAMHLLQDFNLQAFPVSSPPCGVSAMMML